MFAPQVKAGWVDVECGWRPLPQVYLSPGGDSHFPWVEVCADTGLGLIREQKVQGAEAAVTKRSTQINVEQQLVEEYPFPMSRSEGG
ncbi:hypothetical protein QTO34_004796 [Cnephaeus nilssonii]|uniref:Uncharacterized protein n=1 Tax=Cnephaeus nilssonii TaxID=3371016 RepID=A0AA40HQ09_CNENI|nr:hypothetical protein QTO34_004796 [Eptesicus nilssonii]